MVFTEKELMVLFSALSNYRTENVIAADKPVPGLPQLRAIAVRRNNAETAQSLINKFREYEKMVQPPEISWRFCPNTKKLTEWTQIDHIDNLLVFQCHCCGEVDSEHDGTH